MTHVKLEEAHNTFFAHEVNNAKVDMGVTCDLLDSSPSAPSSSNPSCSSSNDSFMSDGFTCDASLMVENETL